MAKRYLYHFKVREGLQEVKLDRILYPNMRDVAAALEKEPTLTQRLVNMQANRRVDEIAELAFPSDVDDLLFSTVGQRRTHERMAWTGWDPVDGSGSTFVTVSSRLTPAELTYDDVARASARIWNEGLMPGRQQRMSPESGTPTLTIEERNACRPSREAITRAPVVLTEIGMREQLALDAEAFLGYSHLREAMKSPAVLAKALCDLEIEPLDAQSVGRYMNEMLVWRVAELKKQGKFAMSALSPASDWDEISAGGYWQHYIQVRWHNIALAYYDQPIPEFALVKAVQIAQHLADASHTSPYPLTFEVDALQENDHIVDPFLKVTLNREQFYIEVWDENRFTGFGG